MLWTLLVASLAVGSLTIGPIQAADATPPTPQQAALSKLQEALQSKNPDHRRQALAALSTIDGANEKAVKLGENALQDKDGLVRAAAATALGEMKAKAAIPSLKEALQDSGEVAFAAANALENMGDASGRDTLIAVLAGEQSGSPGIVANAIRDAKKRLRHPETLVLLGAEDATGPLFGPEASVGVVAAKDAFKMKGTSSRALAAAYLAKDPDPYAVTLLEWALADDNWGVRVAAAKGLGERGNAQSIPKLQFLLDDPHDAVRTMSAAAIIRISDRGQPSAASGN